MHLYLTTFLGTGDLLDPFRARGTEQPGAAVMDMVRPDARKNGPVLVAVPVRDDTIGDYLGQTSQAKPDVAISDGVKDVSVATKQILDSKLGRVLVATDLPSQIVELVVPNLRPTIEGFLEIHFAGGLFWKRPVLRGGAKVFADTFVDANGTLLEAHTPTGPNNGFAWLAPFGSGYDISGNAAGRHTGGLDESHTSVDCDTLDEYAQITFINNDTFLNLIAQGVMCRYRPDGTFGGGTVEWYRAEYFSVSGGDWRTMKMTGGAETVIGTTTLGSPAVAGDVMRIEANGTSIRRLRNGVVQDTTTDSAVATYKRVGVFDSNGTGGGIARFAPFEGGDLVAAPTSSERYWNWIRRARRR